MTTILKMSILGWIIFWLTIGAYTSLIIGAVRDRNDKSQVFTTWFLYFILDILTMFFTVEEDGNFPLLFGFSIGSFIMAFILFYQARFKWKTLETILTIFISICILIRYYYGSHYGIIAGILSEIGVGLYLIYRTYKDPRIKYNLTAYILFLIASILSMLNAKDFSIEEFLYSFVETILSIVIIIPLVKKSISG